MRSTTNFISLSYKTKIFLEVKFILGKKQDILNTFFLNSLVFNIPPPPHWYLKITYILKTLVNYKDNS